MSPKFNIITKSSISLLILVLILNGCDKKSNSNSIKEESVKITPPGLNISDDEIVSAVKNYFSEKPDVRVEREADNGNIFMATYIYSQNISTISIIQKGDYNVDGKYLPIKVKIVTIKDPLFPRIPLTRVGDFKVSYDDFRNIKVQLIDNMLRISKK